MRIKYDGNKADGVIVTIKSGEASASIPKGTPVILDASNVADTTADGLEVALPSTAGNPNSYSLRYGVALQTLASGDLGESKIFGVVPYALITRMTRAGTSTSDSWSSSASVASGVLLGIDTLNNAFLLGASSAGSLPGMAMAVLLDSLPSSTASATTTADARTAITNAVRVFVRML